MKYWNRVLTFFLVIIGFFIGLIVLRQASIESLYVSMGLTSSDYRNMVDFEELDVLLSGYPADEIECGFVEYFKGYWDYRKASGREKGIRAYVLGERRVVCGAREVVKGDVKSGTYKIYKGLNYIKTGWQIVGKDICKIEDRKAIEKTVDRSSWYIESFLECTRGEVNEVIARDYVDLVKEWLELEFECVD